MLYSKCPKCNSKMEIREKQIKGKKVELFVCENAKWKTEDGELFELTENSSCDFKIWGNSFSKYGLKKLNHSQINDILNNKEVIVKLSSQYKKEYQKYIVLDLIYGVKILFDVEVEES